MLIIYSVKLSNRVLTFWERVANCLPFVHYMAALLYLSVFPFGVGVRGVGEGRGRP